MLYIYIIFPLSLYLFSSFKIKSIHADGKVFKATLELKLKPEIREKIIKGNTSAQWKVVANF